MVAKAIANAPGIARAWKYSANSKFPPNDESVKHPSNTTTVPTRVQKVYNTFDA